MSQRGPQTVGDRRQCQLVERDVEGLADRYRVGPCHLDGAEAGGSTRWKGARLGRTDRCRYGTVGTEPGKDVRDDAGIGNIVPRRQQHGPAVIAQTRHGPAPPLRTGFGAGPDGLRDEREQGLVVTGFGQLDREEVGGPAESVAQGCRQLFVRGHRAGHDGDDADVGHQVGIGMRTIAGVGVRGTGVIHPSTIRCGNIPATGS